MKVGLLIAALLSCSLAPLRAADVPVVAISAVPSRFSPDTITLRAGQAIILRFSGVQGTHGIFSDELGVPHTEIPDGQNTDVLVAPKTPGTFTLRCRIYCGPDHPAMVLTVVVTA